MRVAVSISEKKISATMFITNLIADSFHNVIFLTGFGPLQEVRAFSHILNFGKANMRWEAGDDKSLLNGAHTFSQMRVVPKLSGSYAGLYVTPRPDQGYLIGDSEAQCFEIFSRFLDQSKFVHRDWYSQAFADLVKLEPRIGSLRCYRMMDNVEAFVKENLGNNQFALPAPTAAITLEVKQNAPNQG